MRFPDEPLFRFFHWLIDTPTLGGVVVLALSGLALIAVTTTVFWIAGGAHALEEEVYTYPTPTLLDHKESE